MTNEYHKALEEVLEEYLSDYTLEDLFDEFDLDIGDVFTFLLSTGMISENQVVNIFELEVESIDE